MTITRDLKNCPLCDSAVEITRDGKVGWLKCTDPKSTCVGSGLGFAFLVADEETAVAAWNTRAIIGTATPAQPAADTRVVTVAQLQAISLALSKITGRDTADEVALDSLAAEVRSIRAIIGTATPAPSDKIAEAAIDRCMQEIEDIICEADVSYPAGRDAGTSIDFDRDAVLAALRALAGKVE